MKSNSLFFTESFFHAKAFVRAQRAVRAAFFSALSLGLLAGLGGCERQNPDVVSVIKPVSPTGTLYGQVYDAFTRSGIENAQITLLSGNVKTTTDANGSFSFSDVPASNGLAVEMRAEGYSTALVEVVLRNDAGNLAQGNAVAFAGPVYLLPMDDDGFLISISEAGGAPVENAKINASLNVAFVDNVQERGVLIAEITEEASGSYRLSGLPNLGLLAANGIGDLLRIHVRTEDGREKLTTLPLEAAGEPERFFIQMPEQNSAENSLLLIGSNVADLASPALPLLPTVLATNEVVTITFNRSIIEESLYFVAQDALGNILPTNINFSANPVITLTVLGSWPEGLEVQLWVDAIAQAENGAGHSFSAGGSFFAEPNGSLQLLNGQLLNNAGNFICPGSNGFLYIPLSIALGGRRSNASGNVPIVDVGDGATFLPITVTSNTVSAGHPLSGNGLAVLAKLVEPSSGAGRSGFASMLRIPWQAEGISLSNNSQASLQLSVIFNNTAEALSRGTAGTAIVRTPQGAPATQTSRTLTILVSGPASVPCGE